MRLHGWLDIRHHYVLCDLDAHEPTRKLILCEACSTSRTILGVASCTGDMFTRMAKRTLDTALANWPFGDMPQQAPDDRGRQ